MIFHLVENGNLIEQTNCDCCNCRIYTGRFISREDLKRAGWTYANVISSGCEQRIDLCPDCSSKAMSGREIMIGFRGERYKIMSHHIY